MKALILIQTLILLSIQSYGQFGLEELKQIRKYQIKAIYCDTLLERADSTSFALRSVIVAKNRQISEFQLREEIHLDKEVYYRDAIRNRDVHIGKLEAQNKRWKIGCIVFGASTAILTGFLFIPP